MNTTAKAHEPTMEEILASIRRIISDDEPAPTAKGPAPLKPVEKPKKDDVEPAGGLGQDDIDAMLASFDDPEPAPKPAPAKLEAVTKPEALTKFEPAPKPEPVRLPVADTRVHLGGDVDVFELTDEMSADPEPEPAWEPEPAPPPRAPEARQAPYGGERLTSASTDEAVGAAFGTLAHTMLSNNGRTIDDVVKEMLRPMLRAWLDDNLPPLVERLVRQEIERVARGGR